MCIYNIITIIIIVVSIIATVIIMIMIIINIIIIIIILSSSSSSLAVVPDCGCAYTHRLPGTGLHPGAGTNGVFTEGPQIPYILTDH